MDPATPAEAAAGALTRLTGMLRMGAFAAEEYVSGPWLQPSALLAALLAAAPGLQRLGQLNHPVHAADLAWLPRVHRLKELYLRVPGMTDEQERRLRAAFPDLLLLDLYCI